MAEVESQGSVSASDKLADQDVISATDTSSRPVAPHGEHEVTGSEPPTDETSTSGVPGDHEGNGTTNGTLPMPTQPKDIPAADVTEKVDTSATAAMSKAEISKSVKPPIDKSNGGLATPLVKRVSPPTC
jgi:hypothetical protein